MPDPLATLSLSLPGEVAGVVSEAEKAISDLNQGAAVVLGPLARLLLVRRVTTQNKGRMLAKPPYRRARLLDARWFARLGLRRPF